jgi:HD-GYP domain-containing protein (c-di-GMP phosphodiesterase class II)/DNA-binding CsgD family transcriptional regulator
MRRMSPRADQVHLAELLGGLSLGCDLADGFPPEKVMRTVVLAVELARMQGIEGEALRDVYYTSLLRFLGCTAFAHEEANLYGAGDDINTRSVMALADAASPVDIVGRIVRGIGREGPPLPRVRAVAAMLSDPAVVKKHARAQCEASVRLAGIMGLGTNVRDSLQQICERYDGKGAPHGLSADALSLAIRCSHVADIAEIAYHRDGRPAAIEIVRKRAGRQFDPQLAAAFLHDADRLLGLIEGPTVWERFLEAEPQPRALIGPSRLDDVALAFAHFADVKSTWTLGHSTGVAELACRAADLLGEGPAERALLRRAALLHDLGRVAVPNSVWDKPGKLSVSEWERARLHAYYTERILWRSPPLSAISQLASAAHERLDGAGYHRAIASAMIARGARVLAAADCYHAMREPRPHRPALTADEAARALLDDANAGRIDREAARAVLEASGQPAPVHASWPNGLSDREVQVLRLVARGRSNKQIAAELAISARTVQHHVMHIYDKIGVSSRAAAALFATDHSLL